MDQNEIANRLDSVRKGEADLISELLAIEHELPYGSKDFIAPTVALISANQIDIFAQAIEAVRGGKDVFRVAELLRNIFSELPQITASTFLDFLLEYSAKTQNDLAGGRFYEPIKEKCKNEIKWAFSLAEEIFKRNDEKLYSFLITAYLGVAQSDFTSGYDAIIALTKKEDFHFRQNGLRALGLLENVSEDKLEEVVAILLKHSNDSDEGILSNTVFSICKLAKRSEELEKKRLELSHTGSPFVKYEIINDLFGVSFREKTINENNLLILKNICEYSLTYKGITDSLDSILYNLLRNNHEDIVEEILTEWILKHTPKEHYESDFCEIFNSTIYEMVKNQKLMKLIATKWLNSDDSRFHHVLSEAFSYMTSHGVKRAELDLSILAGLAYNDHLYIVRKIIGYILDFDISISLVISFLRLNPLSKEVGNLVASVLVEHIGYNYTHQTIERLKSELETSNENAKKIINLCIGELENRGNELKSLGCINELVPNSDHRIRLDKAFQKAMGKSMEAARAKSPMLGIINHVSIIEGRSWFSFHHGQYNEPSKMQHFSHGVELPRKDVLDEIGASMERTGFRHAKRGES